MKMHSVLSHYIVFSTWIWEIIHLYVIYYAFPYETQTVLPYYDRINGPLTNEQLSFQVPGFVY